MVKLLALIRWAAPAIAASRMVQSYALRLIPRQLTVLQAEAEGDAKFVVTGTASAYLLPALKITRSEAVDVALDEIDIALHGLRRRINAEWHGAVTREPAATFIALQRLIPIGNEVML